MNTLLRFQSPLGTILAVRTKNGISRIEIGAETGIKDSASTTDQVLVQLKQQLLAYLEPARFLRTANCPTSVELNLTRQERGGRPRYVLHLVNHALAGTLTGIVVRFAAEAGFRPGRTVYRSPDLPGKSLPASARRRPDGAIECVVPVLERYGMFVIEGARP